MPRPPKPHLVRTREGDQGKGGGVDRENPEHMNGLPDKPVYLSEDAGEFWDEYCRTTAPGLLKQVHTPALAQLCEDRALEMRLRRSLLAMEEAALRKVERTVAEATEKGETVDRRDLLPGGPLADIAMDEFGTKVFRVLNQICLRVQRQEQQFGLTPVAAVKVDINSGRNAADDFEDALCS